MKGLSVSVYNNKKIDFSLRTSVIYQRDLCWDRVRRCRSHVSVVDVSFLLPQAPLSLLSFVLSLFVFSFRREQPFLINNN